MHTYLKEVEQACSQYSHTKERIHFLKENMMRSKLDFYGLTVGEIRERLKKGFSFSDSTLEDQKKIWKALFKSSNYFEVKSMALIFFQQKKHNLDLKDWTYLKTFTKHIENWEHSDRLSDIYAVLHEKYPKHVFSILRKWNTSKFPWERRQSIVSLFYYARVRKKYPPFSQSLQLIKQLIEDDHIYVQKGVGWALRELYNVYPIKTYAYLETIAQKLAPASWQAATEKLEVTQKKKLKSIRAKKSL